MAERIPLPEELRGRSFTRDQARRAGTTQGRLRRQDVSRPYHGVQTTRAPSTVLQRCHAYEVKLKPGQMFSHRTGARVHGQTLPTDTDDSELDVAALRPADAPHSRGVRGHRLQFIGDLWSVEGLPVPDPAEVFCQLGSELAFEDLVVIADELLNRTPLPEAEAQALLLERIAIIRRIGSAKLVRAVKASRRGSRSPAETRVRLVLEAAGIPRAELNAPITDETTGAYLGSPDLVWRKERVVVEYEGDEHRLDQGQFRYDIVRYDDLAAAGWRVIRATGDHLTRTGRQDLVRRVRRALAAAV